MMNWKGKLYVMAFLMGLLTACNFEDNSSAEDEEIETAEELSEFGLLVQDKFDKKELPYEEFVGFDDYDPSEFLDQDEFEMLELYMVAFEGFSDDRYVAKDWLEFESGIKLLTFYYMDDDGAVSTWAVTYDQEEWYIDNERIGIDFGTEGIIQMTMKSKITENKIERTNTIILEGEDDVFETEIFYIQEDGQIVSESEREPS